MSLERQHLVRRCLRQLLAHPLESLADIGGVARPVAERRVEDALGGFHIVLAARCERRTSSSHSPSGLRMTSAGSGSSTYHAPASISACSSPGCHATSPAMKRA